MCRSSIKNYNSFINDDILLEGNLMATNAFISKLSSIDDKISKILLKSFSDKLQINKDLPQNWIDVTTKDDIVTFVSDRNASRLDKDDIYTSKRRSEIKIGRVARSILSEMGIKYNDKEIEDFVNLYKSSNILNENTLKLVSGIDIKKYYLAENYHKLTGTLGNSCMRSAECQGYFKIYTRNTDSCRLLVYLDKDEKVLARALVWKIESKELYNKNDYKPYLCDAEYFMDRIYSCKDSDINTLISYAKKHNWLYKYRMTSDENLSMVFKYGEHIVIGRIIVKLSRLFYNTYPYVDTLCFTDGDSRISNVGFTGEKNSDDYDEGFIMRNTDGTTDVCTECNGNGYDNDDSDECRLCDGDGKITCNTCHGSTDIFCQDCNGSGNTICDKCSGDGSYDCPKCSGNGRIICSNCEGDGEIKCKNCNGVGNMGKCDKCDSGNIHCKTCNDEPYKCKTCNGIGSYERKWGIGNRVVICKDCGGEGTAKEGLIGKEGCKCPDCGIDKYKRWYNQGYITCSNCDGEGFILCPNCKDEVGTDNGMVLCPSCKGQCEFDCPDCHYGTIMCKKCNETGHLGKCNKCNGVGNLGKCNCQNGKVECYRCHGTGKKEGDVLCPSCAGRLDELLNKLKSNEYRIV